MKLIYQLCSTQSLRKSVWYHHTWRLPPIKTYHCSNDFALDQAYSYQQWRKMITNTRPILTLFFRVIEHKCLRSPTHVRSVLDLSERKPGPHKSKTKQPIVCNSSAVEKLQASRVCWRMALGKPRGGCFWGEDLACNRLYMFVFFSVCASALVRQQKYPLGEGGWSFTNNSFASYRIRVMFEF